MTWDEAIQILRDPSSCLAVLAVLMVLHGIAYQVCIVKIKSIVRQKKWWPNAIPPQRALLVNFGYPKEVCDEATCLWGYAFVIVYCGHHFLAGFAMLPVVIWGWTEAGAAWQFSFIMGALCDVAITTFDELGMIGRMIMPKAFAWLGPKQAVPFFIIVGILHHPLSICMSCPMIWYYAPLKAYHELAVSLLFAAGIHFCTSSYKFTLDTTTKSGFLQCKFIIVLQLVTIFVSRGYFWFTRLYSILLTFAHDGAKGLFWAGCAASILMSFFSLVMMADGLQAAVKWLPKAMPTKDLDAPLLNN